MNQPPDVDFRSLHASLQEARGRDYWRSLDELASTPEFEAMVRREFPEDAERWLDSLSRRRFLTLMGASLGLAGITGCIRQPLEKIVPYLQQPERIVPGKPLYFASAFVLGGFASGVLVESHMGRPTKIEGNPEHPASLGASDLFAQASVLDLYDPDRSQSLVSKRSIRAWGELLDELSRRLAADPATLQIRVLTETVTSPSLADQIRRLLEKFPRGRWHRYDPIDRDHVREGTHLAFGVAAEPIYDFEKADLVVSLDGDFLSPGRAGVRHAKAFSRRRRASEDPAEIGRLYVIETTPGLAGAKADHRLALAPSEIEPFARNLANAVRGLLGDGPKWRPHGTRAAWVQALAEDLTAPGRRGKSLLYPGDHQEPAVHALAQAMNTWLGNVGETVRYVEPVEYGPGEGSVESLAGLTRDMAAGSVELLLVLGGNPVYTAPADVAFARALSRVPMKIHLGLHDDETAELCDWHVPEAHYLETWGDARAFDGTVTVLQPLVEPLYGGRSAHELLATVLGEPGKRAHDLVRGYWERRLGSVGFEAAWQTALHDGVMPGTAARPLETSLALPASLLEPRAAAEGGPARQGVEVVFRPDPTVWDGRFANNAWLQEIPKPLSKLTWDNALLIAPATAKRLELSNGDVVELAVEGRSVPAPVWLLPGHPEGTVTAHLGYGRSRTGKVGSGTGFDAYRVRTAQGRWFTRWAELRSLGHRQTLATTQEHHSMEGRDIVREESSAGGHAGAGHVVHGAAGELSMYEPFEYEGYQWAMIIDLKSCIGCNACVVACQAENNIPSVGKEQVAAGREMHWIRVDRYYRGDPDAPEASFQPVPCMHCENAPCEPVCPVAATAHSDEGLNDMAYNRCVGTRYCSNNCPYKVRRFNFLQYADFETESLKGVRNPDVTVRSRGVMEKCTYCVQRINFARIEAGKEGRIIRDGEVRTACQQACPAEAIAFGDLGDPGSRVSQLRKSHRNYSLLGGLQTKPRTTYLAGARNPNPKLPG